MKTARRKITSVQRFAVFTRDGFRCFYCGEMVYINIPKEHRLHAVVDHKEALKLGCLHHPSNFVTACFGCNSAKSAKPLETFRKDFQRKKQSCFLPSFYGETVRRSEPAAIVPTGKSKENKEKIMANANDVIAGGDFLKAPDLQGKRATVVISEAEITDGNFGKQIVLSFEGKDKKFSLNKINTRMIINLLGTPETDEWIGRAISLRPDKTQNPEGAIVDCIRVDFELPEQPRPQAAQAASAQGNPNSFGDDSAIPF